MPEIIAKITSLFNENCSFVCYHLPNSETINYLFDFKANDKIKSNVDVPTFIINSWNNEKIIIEGKQHFSTLINDFPCINSNKVFCAKTKKEIDKPHFVNFVNNIKKGITTKQFNKVVASRPINVQPPENFNIFTTFSKMVAAYPTAFSYLFYHKETQTCWLGATPETLLSVKNSIAETMALAGTKPYSPNGINWTDKEIEEQQFVTNYITSLLNQQELDYKISKLQTHKAGHLAHLKNTFTINLDKPEQLDKLIKLLHPTPAVAGLPKQESINFINQFEGYDRENYTGFIGVKQSENLQPYFVNLRCMQVFNNNIVLYVGAGITENSDAEKEWQETELKAKQC